MKKVKMSFDFETVNKNSEGMLIGGFSMSMSSNHISLGKKNDKCQTINNCNGGNCVKGCGATD